MRASEKLRALTKDAQWTPADGYSDLVVDSEIQEAALAQVVAALSLIADVVEAAEVAEHFATGRGDEWPKLRAAITALREAL